MKIRVGTVMTVPDGQVIIIRITRWKYYYFYCLESDFSNIGVTWRSKEDMKYALDNYWKIISE